MKKTEQKFYNGTKLITLKDIGGQTPEIFMCCGNRTAGKTFYFKRMLLRRFINSRKKFCILVRFNYELDGVAENFFFDIGPVSFQGHQMSDKPVGRNLFMKLFFDGEHCGYAVALNSADTIKKYSSRFVDVDAIFFDEFQPETNKYCPDEFEKFVSIHISIARGGGEHVRYVPVYMCSNSYSLLNLYFVRFGVHKRLGNGAKFVRGDGWVLEMTLNEHAAKAYTSSAFGRAIATSNQGSRYNSYVAQNKFLADSNAFICKMSGPARFFVKVTRNGQTYGIWAYDRQGIMFVSHKFDPSWPINLAFDTNDHDVNLVLVKHTTFYVKQLKEYFDVGMLRFEDVDCKNLFMDLVGYAS